MVASILWSQRKVCTSRSFHGSFRNFFKKTFNLQTVNHSASFDMFWTLVCFSTVRVFWNPRFYSTILYFLYISMYWHNFHDYGFFFNFRSVLYIGLVSQNLQVFLHNFRSVLYVGLLWHCLEWQNPCAGGRERIVWNEKVTLFKK